MYLVILILLLVVLLAILVGVVYVLVRACRARSWRALLGTLVAVVAVPWLGWKWLDRSLTLAAVPDGLQVSSILYAEERTWGIGPGGNETGLRLYRLPDDVAGQVARGGADWLRNAQSRPGPFGTIYGEWQATPLPWKPREGTAAPDLRGYLCRYGFCIDVDADVLRQANEMVSEAGGYYAVGGGGAVIVVSPKRRLVLQFFAG